MIITKISRQIKDPERASIYVDGKFYAGLHKVVVFKLGLKVGLTLTPELASQLNQTESTQSIWDYSLRNLSASPKSRRRITEKLTVRFPESEVGAAVDQLEAAGLVDDVHLAEMVVSYQMRMANKSRREIAAQLYQKGIDKETSAKALLVVDDEYELATAKKLAEMKMGSSTTDDQTKLKIAQYLGRKGFDYSIIRKATEGLAGDV